MTSCRFMKPVSTRSAWPSWWRVSKTISASTPSRSRMMPRSRSRSATSSGRMKMSPREIVALRDYLGPELTGRTISDARQIVSLSDILGWTCLGNRLGELAGRAVLLAVTDQLISGLAMTELDGVARRMLLCPPDVSADHVRSLVQDAGIDAVVTDRPAQWNTARIDLSVTAPSPAPSASRTPTERATEWLMLTSGTSGVPKLVRHTLEGLTGAIIADGPARGGPAVWATFYDIRRYGGLQIFLRAIIR